MKSDNLKSLPDLVTTKCKIVEEGITPDSFDDSQLPTDVHIIRYTVGGETYFDAVRSFSKVDIFDAYFDRLKGVGHITSINSGYGKIKPRLYGKIDG